MEIYLDNAATTRPIPEAVAAVNEACADGWYNPSSLYAPCAKAAAAVNEARRFLTQAAGAADCVFTSGGTEANNTAIHSAVRPGARQHFVCSMTEHSSVYETMKLLSQAGHSVDFIYPRDDFRIHAQDVAQALRPDTAMVAVMQVNSETGAVNDVAGISRAVAQLSPRALYLCDCVQAFMKMPLLSSRAHMCSVSAHKIGALKGTGALLLMDKSVHLHPFITGGGQEHDRRAGTENTAGIAAFCAAAMHWRQNAQQYSQRMAELRRMAADDLALIDGVVINSAPDEYSAPHILNVSFPGVRGETLLHSLEQRGIYVGVGSACSSKKGPSRVIAAQNFERERLEGVIRISLSPFNTAKDIEIFLTEAESAYKNLKGYIRR